VQEEKIGEGMGVDKRLYLPTVIIAFGLLAAVAIQKPLWPWHPEFDMPWDHHHYIAMAEEQSYLIHPFATRILIPALAGLIGFAGSIPVAFFIISWFALTSVGVMLYDIGGWRSVAVWTFCLYAWLMPFWDFYLPDAAMLAMITLAFYMCVKQVRWEWFIPLTIAAMLTKEVGLLIPLIVFLFSPYKWQGIGLGLLGLGIYIGLTNFIPRMNGSETWITEQIPTYLHSGALWCDYGIRHCWAENGFNVLGILHGSLPALLLLPLAERGFMWRAAIVFSAVVCASTLGSPERAVVFAIPVLALAPIRKTWR